MAVHTATETVTLEREVLMRTYTCDTCGAKARTSAPDLGGAWNTGALADWVAVSDMKRWGNAADTSLHFCSTACARAHFANAYAAREGAR